MELSAKGNEKDYVIFIGIFLQDRCVKTRAWCEGPSATSLTHWTWKADPKGKCGSIWSEEVVPKELEKHRREIHTDIHVSVDGENREQSESVG